MQKQITARLEDELYLKLKVIAEKERRSFNAQLEQFIDEKIKSYEAANGKIKIDVEDLYK